MDRTCYKCGTPVEEGVPFCPECKAPQIRVAFNEPATPPLGPGTPEQVQPPAQPVPLENEVHWRDAIPGSVTAGVIISISWFIPFAPVLLAIIGAGALAAAMYSRRRPQAHMTAGMGARIGAISGLFAFLLFTLMLISAGGEFVRKILQQAIAQAAAAGNPNADQVMQTLNTQSGMAALVIMMLAVFLTMMVALSAVGGAIGARLFRRRKLD